MLTVNQRDLLAAIITDRYVLPGAEIEEWVEKFLEYRKMIEEYEIGRANNVQKEEERNHTDRVGLE